MENKAEKLRLALKVTEVIQRSYPPTYSFVSKWIFRIENKAEKLRLALKVTEVIQHGYPPTYSFVSKWGFWMENKAEKFRLTLKVVGVFQHSYPPKSTFEKEKRRVVPFYLPLLPTAVLTPSASLKCSFINDRGG